MLSADSTKNVFAGIGVAAVTLSLAHAVRVAWNSYKERRSVAALEEYPNPNAHLACPLIPLRWSTFPACRGSYRHMRINFRMFAED